MGILKPSETFNSLIMLVIKPKDEFKPSDWFLAVA